jgi:tRNA uridine 5-carboxymethylaminomethyl modification enzyme
MLHSIKGFENARVMRNAYAIEYDCTDPLALDASLEFKEFPGLFGAGQFNGTSGYEEAAAQGLVAGINAAMRVLGKEKLVLPRNSSYIGTLIDDLVTKGTNEPYRIMTSRSEYRLLLRQDNADRRLTDIGRKFGLVSDEQYERYLLKKKHIDDEIERVRATSFGPSDELSKLLEEAGSAPNIHGIKMADLLRRPEITYEMLAPIDKARPENLTKREKQAVEIEIKYEGYIKKELAEAQRFSKLEEKRMPEEIDYYAIKGIRAETQQKLTKFRPKSIGQASRISGVSPADISVLLIYLESYNKNSEEK